MTELIDQIARSSYAKLLAYLASRYRGDIQAAEDALADAFASALEHWQDSGVPKQPEAWLLKVAQHRLIDQARKTKRQTLSSDWKLLEESRTLSTGGQADDRDWDVDSLPDERLHMMFACAHPAIDVAVRTPLLLQVVLGLSGERIAAAFLVSPKTMSQRLVRAKNKIRDAGISFRLPEQLTDRVQTVLDAIYAAFAIGWDGVEPSSQELVADAIQLVRIVVAHMPDNAEAGGLLALLLYCDARQAARGTRSGRFIPLLEQNPDLWDSRKIEEAEFHLHRVARLGQLGRCQLEAAIQSAHLQGRRSQNTDWPIIVGFYDALLHYAPTIGVRIARAAALASSGNPLAGLEAIELIDLQAVQSHQPYWAVKAEILRQLGRPECAQAYERAIGLCSDPAVRIYLQQSSTGRPGTPQ